MIPLATCINDLEAIGQKAMSVADDKDLWLEREKGRDKTDETKFEAGWLPRLHYANSGPPPANNASVHRAADLHFDAGERETKMTLCRTTRPR